MGPVVALPYIFSAGAIVVTAGSYILNRSLNDSQDKDKDFKTNEVGYFVHRSEPFFVNLCDFIERNGTPAPPNDMARSLVEGVYPLALVFGLKLLKTVDKKPEMMVVALPPDVRDQQKSNTHPDRFVPYKIVSFPRRNGKSIKTTVSFSTDAIKLTYKVAFYQWRSTWRPKLDDATGLYFAEKVSDKTINCEIYQSPVPRFSVDQRGAPVTELINTAEEEFILLDNTARHKKVILDLWVEKTGGDVIGSSNKGTGGILFGNFGVGKSFFVLHLAVVTKSIVYEFRNQARQHWGILARKVQALTATRVICMFDEIHRIQFGQTENDIDMATFLKILDDLLQNKLVLVVGLCNTEQDISTSYGRAAAAIRGQHRLGSFTAHMLPIQTKADVRKCFEYYFQDMLSKLKPENSTASRSQPSSPKPSLFGLSNRRKPQKADEACSLIHEMEMAHVNADELNWEEQIEATYSRICDRFPIQDNITVCELSGWLVTKALRDFKSTITCFQAEDWVKDLRSKIQDMRKDMRSN